MKQAGVYLVLSMAMLLAATLGYFSMSWRSPDFSGYRGVALAAAVAVAVLLILSAALCIWKLRAGRLPALPAWAGIIAGAIALASLGQVVAIEGRYQWMRYYVLNSDPARLAVLGRHFIVGYRHERYVEVLVQRSAVAGFFITRRNISGMEESEVRREIDWLRSHHSGLPVPMWIATDQEGGAVSRLSPPLPWQPGLGQVIADLEPQSEHTTALEYGRHQAQGLASLGVNLNLAPVVDIDHQVDNPADRFTRISSRALSDDPAVVTSAAGAYCQGLAEHGVRCTLKHFPGIGRVFNDTHVERAVLAESPERLADTDWLPFRQLAGADSAPWMMLSHVTLAQLDPDRPVSTSAVVVQGLIREQWQFQGVLVTDDICMRAIHDAPGGVGQATVDALNAGVDMILISYDPDQYFPAMYAALKADREGSLDHRKLEQSRLRLEQEANRFGASH